MNLVQQGIEGVPCIAEKFLASDLGAPFRVYLHNSVTITTNEETGEVLSYKIPDLEGLIQAVVIKRVLDPRKLRGAELKFVRKSIGLKQKELAARIDMTPEHLSRCEADALVMSPSTEKLFRVFALKSAIKLNKEKASDAKTELEDAVDRIFDGMKPVSAFDVEHELEMHFSRVPVSGDVDSNDGHWDGEQEAA